MNPSDIIEGTIEQLEQSGWCQGEFEDPDTGKMCIIGAMDHRYGNNLNMAGYESKRYARMKLRDRVGNIMGWNDAKGRTWPQVRFALEETAKELRNEGR